MFLQLPGSAYDIRFCQPGSLASEIGNCPAALQPAGLLPTALAPSGHTYQRSSSDIQQAAEGRQLLS